jgi:hypothetical protein
MSIFESGKAHIVHTNSGGLGNFFGHPHGIRIALFNV